MPYGISNSQPDCSGWATVKKTGSGYETIGCHKSKVDAIDQMVAVSLSEKMEPLGDIGKRYSPNQPRDKDGKWTAGAGGVALSRKEMSDRLLQDESPGIDLNDPDVLPWEVQQKSERKAQKAHKELMRSDAQTAYAKGLDPEQRAAVREYTTDGHLYTNRLLRGAPPPPLDRSDENYDYAARLAETAGPAIANAPPLGMDTTLYRGFQPPANPELGKLRVGDVITDRGIVSTTVSPDKAVGFMGDKYTGVGGVMRISAPAATRGLAVAKGNQLSKVGDEFEVILPPGSQFRVTSISGNLIDVEVVTESQRSLRYNPNQPRDKNGKWTSGVGGAPMSTSEMQARLIDDAYPGIFDDDDIGDETDFVEHASTEKLIGLRDRPEQTEYVASLDESEVLAVREYTGSSYEAANKLLRGAPPPPPDPMDDDYDVASAVAGTVAPVLRGAPPLGQQTTLYRGFSAQGGEQFDGLQVGSVITDNGIISTSVAPTSAVNFMIHGGGVGGVMRIDAPPATRGLALGSKLTEYEEELEVLLPPGTSFRVTAISGNLIDVEVVTESQRSLRYSPNQPRDEGGQWTAGAGGAHMDTVEMQMTLIDEQYPGIFDSDEIGDEIEFVEVKSAELHETIRDKQQAYVDGLDELETQAVQAYTGDAFVATNKLMRGAPPPPLEVGSEEHDTASAVAMVVTPVLEDAPPLGVQATLYRGFTAKGGAQFEGLQVGSVITDDGIISTTVSPISATPFMRGDSTDGVGGIMRISAPPATRGLAVGAELSMLDEELEVILPPGTSFRVTGISGNLIDVEVVVE